MYAGEAVVWLGRALFYGRPAVWAGATAVSDHIGLPVSMARHRCPPSVLRQIPQVVGGQHGAARGEQVTAAARQRRRGRRCLTPQPGNAAVPVRQAGEQAMQVAGGVRTAGARPPVTDLQPVTRRDARAKAQILLILMTPLGSYSACGVPELGYRS